MSLPFPLVTQHRFVDVTLRAKPGDRGVRPVTQALVFCRECAGVVRGMRLCVCLGLRACLWVWVCVCACAPTFSLLHHVALEIHWALST